jgi:hypothetical protein
MHCNFNYHVQLVNNTPFSNCPTGFETGLCYCQPDFVADVQANKLEISENGSILPMVCVHFVQPLNQIC